jgi:hypothetical protein
MDRRVWIRWAALARGRVSRQDGWTDRQTETFLGIRVRGFDGDGRLSVHFFWFGGTSLFLCKSAMQFALLCSCKQSLCARTHVCGPRVDQPFCSVALRRVPTPKLGFCLSFCRVALQRVQHQVGVLSVGRRLQPQAGCPGACGAGSRLRL